MVASLRVVSAVKASMPDVPPAYVVASGPVL